MLGSEETPNNFEPVVAFIDTEDDAVDYEEQRQANILKNQELLKQLGLGSTLVGIPEECIKIETQPVKKRRSVTRKPKGSNKPKSETTGRISRRLRGEEPVMAVPLLEEKVENSETQIEHSSKLKNIKTIADYDLPDELHLPFTLRSIKTTVWEIGTIHHGPGKEKYWSNSGCMFRHPYPVGYRATKEHLGRIFDMNIKSSDKGPIFEVAQVGTLQNWKGPTPTAPWTEACLTSRSKGTRVSGPLFFGFSDPLTQKLIEGLPNFEPYDSVFPPKDTKKSRSK